MAYKTLTKYNIDSEHICCAFSDKKCSESYELKKQWLKREFDNGYVFRRLDERAKVFIEYGPAEKAWIPVTALNFLIVNCFWVSGKYKGNGHGKALLQHAIDEAMEKRRVGLVTVVGTKKYNFMSDTKWLMGQGFEICETTPAGFALLVKYLRSTETPPAFNESAKTGECPEKNGYAAYYSNRCPYSAYHVENTLMETVKKRDLVLTTVKLDTMDKARSAPSPATIFSLFKDGKFVTTDISVCLDSRFDKIVNSKT